MKKRYALSFLFFFYLFIGMSFFTYAQQQKLTTDTLKAAKEPTEVEESWLRTMVVPILSTDMNSDDKDLNFLNELPAKVKVVALGEVSHGSVSVYKVKDRIVKYLVENEGYTVFAMEAPMAEANKINEFTIDGKGDPKELLNNLKLWPWDTQEMLDLLLWMRPYNSTHDKKVRFTGFDMTVYQGAFYELCRIYNAHASENKMDSTQPLFANLKSVEHIFYSRNGKSDTISKGNLKLLKVYKNTIDSTLDVLNSFSKQIADVQEQAAFLQMIRVLHQYAEYHAGNNTAFYLRDQSMSENVLSIIKNDTTSKVILWAHNEHIRNGFLNMGMFLTDSLKNRYITIGFTFHEGSYTAYGKYGYTCYDAQTSYPGTYEYYFHKAGLPMFILDLHKAHKTDIGCAWLYNDDLKFRITGARQIDEEFGKYPLLNAYDEIIFIDRSTNSTLLQPQ